MLSYREGVGFDGRIVLFIVFAILVILFLIYLISAIRNRGKPKPEHHGTGNLGGLGGYSWPRRRHRRSSQLQPGSLCALRTQKER